MSRYPYTEACDYIRGKTAEYSELHGIVIPTLSRSQASQVRSVIARVLGMDDEELARKIADFARAEEDGK
ncbi:hypothetical protein [Burkholderia gladioli]|uniref:hypothetical protein n=1 Tax=Burkholderia gladioli TaxID=28095 RepID=UPI00163E0F2D|nr:hypothetical protein [Burkholderia gladioli]